MIHLSGDIIFAEKQKLTVGNSEINTWVYYDPEKDKRERSAESYSPVNAMMVIPHLFTLCDTAFSLILTVKVLESRSDHPVYGHDQYNCGMFPHNILKHSVEIEILYSKN